MFDEMNFQNGLEGGEFWCPSIVTWLNRFIAEVWSVVPRQAKFGKI